MSSSVPKDLYPVAVIQDRYQGGYSRGAWLAIACAEQPLMGDTRIGWMLVEGPSSGDPSAATFWLDPPAWVAVGRTPDDAIAKLVEVGMAEDDD